MHTTFSKQLLDLHQVNPKFLKVSTGNSHSKIKFVFQRTKAPHAFLQKEESRQNSSLTNEYVQAKGYISYIVDPLWKDICMDLLNLMGPASILKVWESKLGEFSSQNKYMDIVCETEETAIFVRQYDFVILGSLRRYFPELKQLKVTVMPTSALLTKKVEQANERDHVI